MPQKRKPDTNQTPRGLSQAQNKRKPSPRPKNPILIAQNDPCSHALSMLFLVGSCLGKPCHPQAKQKGMMWEQRKKQNQKHVLSGVFSSWDSLRNIVTKSKEMRKTSGNGARLEIGESDAINSGQQRKRTTEGRNLGMIARSFKTPHVIPE